MGRKRFRKTCKMVLEPCILSNRKLLHEVVPSRFNAGGIQNSSKIREVTAMPTTTCPSRDVFLQYSLGLVSEEESHLWPSTWNPARNARISS